MNSAEGSVRPGGLAAADLAWFAMGAALAVAGATRRSRAGSGLTLVAAPLIARGLLGRWPWPESGGFPLRISRAYVQVVEAATVERPAADVFAFWRQLENLPRFMRHVESVMQDEGGSTWVARGPAGLRVRWIADVTQEVENELIAWRSRPGSDIETEGAVLFEPGRHLGATRVVVRVRYAVPGGPLAKPLAAVLGGLPAHWLRADLHRLKQLLEAREIARAKPEAEQ